MELPDDVLQIIKEYSMPLTRPDWRTLHKMTQQLYKEECFRQSIMTWNRVTENNIFTLWWYTNMYAETYFEN
jgi:hypothetical protein